MGLARLRMGVMVTEMKTKGGPSTSPDLTSSKFDMSKRAPAGANF